ncbi:MAG TPA: hypothetical protein VFN70_04835, partial [Burkholderiales bacterium]|nr:hypothetical protein [Burkholderiales bacterium]
MSQPAGRIAISVPPAGALLSRRSWLGLAGAIAFGAVLPLVVTSTLAITLLTQAVIGGILATA